MIKKYFIELGIKIGVGIISILLAVLLFYIFFYHRHDFGEWSLVKEPSCTDEGVETRVCSCGATENRYLAKEEHIPGEWVVDADYNEKTISCTVCQTVLKTEALSEHTHNWSKWEIEKEATCTEAGILARTCECGARDENTLAKAEHIFGDWETVKEPECEALGLRERSCNCGETETEDIPALDHAMGEWVFNESMDERHYPCSRCGKILQIEELIFSEGLEIENGIVIGIGSCADTEITIPFMHEGKVITEIADKAFYKNKTVERITLPQTVYKIGSQAFWQCSSLRYVNLENVTEISDRAFAHCTSLLEIEINQSLTKLEMSVFECCDSLSVINFSGSVEQWNALPKNEYWDEYTNNYTVYCTNGEIQKER